MPRSKSRPVRTCPRPITEDGIGEIELMMEQPASMKSCSRRPILGCVTKIPRLSTPPSVPSCCATHHQVGSSWRLGQRLRSWLEPPLVWSLVAATPKRSMFESSADRSDPNPSSPDRPSSSRVMESLPFVPTHCPWPALIVSRHTRQRPSGMMEVISILPDARPASFDGRWRHAA